MFGREVIHAHPHVWLLNVSLVVTSLVILHFLFTYIYIYVYIHIVLTFLCCSIWFVPNLGQPWGAIQNCTGEVSSTKTTAPV